MAKKKKRNPVYIHNTSRAEGTLAKREQSLRYKLESSKLRHTTIQCLIKWLAIILCTVFAGGGIVWSLIEKFGKLIP